MTDSIPSIDEQFARSLPEDPRRAFLTIVDTFQDIRAMADKSKNWQERERYLEVYMPIYALSRLMIKRLKMTGIKQPDLDSGNVTAISSINDYFYRFRNLAESIRNELFIEARTEEFSRVLSIEHYYEFSDDDIVKIQQLLNDLRNIVVQSTFFDDDHKRRLLKRLERLQTELHKKMSDLDRFWGLIGDAGVAVGKWGKEAKPFFDRIRELAEIVWRAQAEAEKLPEGTDFPMLSNRAEQ